MKVVEHSSGGIGLMIKESDLRVVQSGGLNHISNNLAYIIFSIRFYLKNELLFETKRLKNRDQKRNSALALL